MATRSRQSQSPPLPGRILQDVPLHQSAGAVVIFGSLDVGQILGLIHGIRLRQRKELNGTPSLGFDGGWGLGGGGSGPPPPKGRAGGGLGDPPPHLNRAHSARRKFLAFFPLYLA
jgi:hypothetical protein